MHTGNIVKRRIACIIICAIFFFVLLAHTWILYPFLPTHIILYQAFLRLLVVVAPVVLTLILVSKPLRNVYRYPLLLLWIFFIPYPFYNIFQLRHIAEIIDLRDHSFFTQGENLALLWKIIPVALYAITEAVLFVFCMNAVIQTIKQERIRILISLLLLVYISSSTIIGLTSRLDTFHILTKPFAVIGYLLEVLHTSVLLLNLISVFCFASFLYFAYRLFCKCR